MDYPIDVQGHQVYYLFLHLYVYSPNHADFNKLINNFQDILIALACYALI